MLSKNNVIIAHKDKDNLLKKVDEINLSDNIVQSVINKDRSVVEFTYNYDRFIGNSVEIGDTGWQIMSSLPREEFMLNTNQLVLIIIAVFVILLVVLIGVLYVLINKLTKPITDITNITNKLAEGELDVNIDINSDDEIGVLANSIRKLTERLKLYIIYIDESVGVIDKMAEGHLNMELKNDYAGEFAKLKKSLLNMSNTLKDAIGKIQQSSIAINMNAEQVSTGAQTLAQGTTEQASAIEDYQQKSTKFTQLS